MTATRAVRNLVHDHLLALHIGSEVTKWFRKEREPQVLDVTPENVIATLHRARINPVLMGTHGINVYRDEARATQDVDVLVTKRDVRKAIRVLEEAFPYLEVHDLSAVTRFVNAATQKVVLDVMKPSSHAIQVVFRHTVPIQETHRIPTLEMAIVSKFLAMQSPTRKQSKRQIDLGDFMNMIETNRASINRDKLERLSDEVQPRGAALMRKLIAEMDAGGTLRLP
jgi:hypothetical protein